jgi:hypothetical protein
MLRDLPSYANRVVTRATQRQNLATASHVILAGQPEFEPLPLTANPEQVHPDLTVKQVFFTTLERQRTGDRLFELQQYHWAFLVQTRYGWQLVTLYSQIGSYPADERSVSPARESSSGAIGQAMRLWLRDCQAGAVRP